MAVAVVTAEMTRIAEPFVLNICAKRNLFCRWQVGVFEGSNYHTTGTGPKFRTGKRGGEQSLLSQLNENSWEDKTTRIGTEREHVLRSAC